MAMMPLLRTAQIFERSRIPAFLSSRAYHVLSSNNVFRPYQHTKYRLTTEFDPGTTKDDIFLAAPSRDDLAKTTKNVSLLLRFLRLVTEQENRSEDFTFFAKRCDSGLVVEKDVYITKEELLSLLWKNGYSELEMNAYEIAFPADYKFHYPELAVLFCIPEEDCYKFSLRTRAKDQATLVTVAAKPTTNMIATYGLLSTAAWFGLQNQVLGNAWMFVKTLPFFSVFYMLASYFQRNIAGHFYTQAAADVQISTTNKLNGQDALYNQIKVYSNDALCLTYVEAFQRAVKTQMERYRQHCLVQEQARAAHAIEAHLAEVETAERQIEASLQAVIVEEAMSDLRTRIETDPTFQTRALGGAISALAGENGVDPVGDALKKAFTELHQNLKTPFVKNVTSIFKQQEAAFLERFAVTKEQAKEMSALRQEVIACGDSDIVSEDRICLDSLPADLRTRLERTCKDLARKVGLSWLFQPAPSLLSDHSAAEDRFPFYTEAAKALKVAEDELLGKRIAMFLKAF